jgi:hypothetical protein
MILDTESWMNIRRFRALHDAGVTYVEIGRECGVDWRTAIYADVGISGRTP